MLTLSDPGSFPTLLRGGVLCVGNFDGVHAGHALMLQTGQAKARELSSSFVVMTFEPHPSVVLKGAANGSPPRRPLTTLEQRLELLEAFGPDAVIVIPTSREFLGIEADAFLRNVVQQQLGSRWMVEGANFTFGRGAKGTVATLQHDGPAMGLGVTVVPTVTRVLGDLQVVNVSSTLIRWLIEHGRVADAARCLGRPYTFRGPVVEGARRGRTIGFPTANVASPQLIPAPGVYAGSARVADSGNVYPAAISVGTNPTFGGQTMTVEAYLLDFSGDLYGRTVEIRFSRFLREMLKFGSVDALVRQMRADVEKTRAVAASPVPETITSP